MANKIYLAYGSNLNIHQMQARCPDAKVIGTAVIEDYELLFKGRETGFYLTIEPKAGARVPVAAWQVSEADEQSLDRYEDYPDFYYKKELMLPVRSINSGTVRQCRAFVYIIHENKLPGMPSESYVETCMEGYRSFGFDPDLLRRAVEVSRRSCHEEGQSNGCRIEPQIEPQN